MDGFICAVDGKPCSNIAITGKNKAPCRACPRRLGAELNKVFIVEKGNRRARWKIIAHPFFDGGFAVVSDHQYMISGVDPYGANRDKDHIASGASTFEMACEQAYDMT